MSWNEGFLYAVDNIASGDDVECCQHSLFAHQTVRAMLGLTTLANRNPHGTMTPCYVRLFTGRIVEALGFVIDVIVDVSARYIIIKTVPIFKSKNAECNSAICILILR
jgi:hypothetical protein